MLGLFFQTTPALEKAALEYGAKSENGKVTFTDAAQEKEFLQVAKALLSAGARKFSKAWHGSVTDYILEKLSARRQEEIKKMLDGITLVSPNRLSPRKRALRDWGHEMGVPVVFFKGDPSLHGFHSDGVTFLNVDSEITPQWTFWHEAMHWMKANNPDLYNDIVAEHMSDADVIEEMIADDGARITLRDEKALLAVTYSQTDKSMKWIKA